MTEGKRGVENKDSPVILIFTSKQNINIVVLFISPLDEPVLVCSRETITKTPRSKLRSATLIK